MTRTRYCLAVLFQSFGLVRKNKRLTDIAFEMHLLQDGEELLGAACWPETEEIEEVSMEYWSIRRLEREQAAIISKIEEAETTLQTAQQKRVDLVDESKEVGEELLKTRESLFEKIEVLNHERETIMQEAQVIKRRHGALKMKAKVLLEEGEEASEKIMECRSALAELKLTFEGTKMRLSQMDSRITSEERQLSEIQQQIDDKLKGSKGKAQESFGLISQANRNITKFQAELGLLQEDYSKLCRDIGRFLSINDSRPDCRQACGKRKGLLAQLRILRQSVQWNRKLVDQAG